MNGKRIYWMEVDGKRVALHRESLADAFAAIRNVVPEGTVIACTGVEDA